MLLSLIHRAAIEFDMTIQAKSLRASSCQSLPLCTYIQSNHLPVKLPAQVATQKPIPVPYLKTLAPGRNNLPHNMYCFLHHVIPHLRGTTTLKAILKIITPMHNPSHLSVMFKKDMLQVLSQFCIDQSRIIAPFKQPSCPNAHCQSFLWVLYEPQNLLSQ